MADESAQPAKLTAEDLTQLVSHMTAGDFWRFSNQTGNQQAQTIMEALHRVAIKQGLANGEAIDTFLDRVEMGDLLALIGGQRPLAQGAGDGSQTSVDTGE